MVTPIDLVVTDEQQQLRDSLRRLLADKASLATARPAMESGSGFDRGLWAQMAELGLPALLVPEGHGGLGQGASETTVVFEEMGRALYHGPLLATVALATNALLVSGDQAAQADLLPGVASGQTIATLATSDGSEPVVATPNEDGWTLRGVKTFVVDGMAADLIVVTAATAPGAGLFAVDAASTALSRRSLSALDLSRPLAEITFSGTPARLVGAEGAAEATMADVEDRLAITVAAEAVGGMRACLDLSVEHAKARKQFGVPIGSFQAVAHTCVDMLRDAELGASAVQYAAAAQDQRAEDFSLAARVAAAWCGPAYHRVTAQTIHIHGGLGFTWEHHAHLYYRRSRSNEQLFGALRRHRDLVADRVGL